MPKLLQLCASDGSDTTQTRADDFKFDEGRQPSHEPGKFEGTQLRLLDDVNPFAGNSLPLDAQASAPLTGGWHERRGSVKCNTKPLHCSESQMSQIKAVHDDGRAFVRTFSTSVVAQHSAQKLVKELSLDDTSLEQLESKWSVAWSDEWKDRKGRRIGRRVVYQW
ncbi:hypothetical protein BC629DRAFT_920496 [Irpex lacteus]|nr:hypothetical protein BC629DRAFT_920496 [Irpex lacteus]